MDFLFDFITQTLQASWSLFREAAIYMLFGLLIGGLLKVFMSAEYVAKHLGKGRFSSVFKAALMGIPIPLCSCGVLPAAASLKKQGANNGATTAFLISTPESGVDSISITYALLDPIMTVARPVAAFISAITAGLAENLFNPPNQQQVLPMACGCSSDEAHDHHGATGTVPKGFFAKFGSAAHHAGNDLWAELAGWFFFGLLLAGAVTVLVPDDMMSRYLGGGFSSMLLMLAVGIPLYICATASTPIAAALIMKGVSPGTCLVFLLVGPATNMASLTVLSGLLGKRATALYLVSISVVSILCGLTLDMIYLGFGISAAAVAGASFELIPEWLELGGAIVLLLLSIRPLYLIGQKLLGKKSSGCGCSGSECSTQPTADHKHDHGNECGCGGSCEPPSIFPMA
ncbi:MAG: SO_0444 family Cu/Zn efflux transporter [Desulfobulbaceae bacterium]|nr:SO_0444 family Cu/Zn efflux transporter [Desulfobulbaceae bacterium]